MKYPARAANKFIEKIRDQHFRSIFKRIFKKLNKIKHSIAKADYAHQEVDRYIKKIIDDKNVAKSISCKKGCSACCFTQVSINSDEAKLLAKLVVQGVGIDLHKLHIQAKVCEDSKEWLRLPYHDRGCVFLDSSNHCKIYNSRPSVCRTNLVFSNPFNCKTHDGVEKPLIMVNTSEADMVVMASFVTSDGGALPQMLMKAIDELNDDRVKLINQIKSRIELI